VRYTVRLESSAEHDLRHLPKDVLKRVDAKLAALVRQPRPRGAVKLQAREDDGWRVRVGDYRVLYTVDDAAGVVSVYHIRPRGSAYR
jgi:mRNA interferase RelE/StbE